MATSRFEFETSEGVVRLTADMASSASLDRRDHSSSVRNLKLLVVILLCSNVGLGVLSFFLLRAVDERYSDLLDHTVPLLNDLQTLTAKSVDAMRGTNPEEIEKNPGSRSVVVGNGRAGVANDRALREKALARQWPAELAGGHDEVQRAGEQFTRLCEEVLGLQAAGNREGARQARDERLRPAFDRYLVVLTKTADLVEEHSGRTNDQYSGKTGNFSKIVLGLGSWPVLAVIALLVFTVAFVGVLMLAFRGRDVSEAP